MEFQYDKSWEILTTILTSKISAREAWTKFIDFHEKNYPKPYWAKLKQIDIDTEQNQIVDWITAVVTQTPLPKKVAAIWVGLLKFVDENKNEIPTIYFGGAENYDKDDSDWACDL